MILEPRAACPSLGEGTKVAVEPIDVYGRECETSIRQLPHIRTIQLVVLGYSELRLRAEERMYHGRAIVLVEHLRSVEIWLLSAQACTQLAEVGAQEA